MLAVRILRFAMRLGKERDTVRLCRNLANVCSSSSGNGKNNEKGCDQKDSSRVSRSCDMNSSTPTMYDCRKYGHMLPSNDWMPCFDPLPNIPTGVFRYTAGEVLGQGANKCSSYQNPEYFSFQHMSYYDMHRVLREYRQPSAKTGRKP